MRGGGEDDLTIFHNRILKRLEESMKVEVRQLREVMDALTPLIPRKPKHPILNHILLKDGKAIATDLQHTVILDFPEVAEELLLHKEALDFLRYIPGYLPAEISVQEGEPKTVLISCGGSKRTCPWADPGIYPPLPQIPDIRWHLDGDQLTETLVMATAYACKDDSRPVLTGVTLALEESQSFVASGDGYRMFYREMPGTSGEPVTVIIPTATVGLLRDLWKSRSGPEDPAMDALLAEIALAKRLIGLGITLEEKQNRVEGLLAARFGEVTLLSRLIPGNPPDWRALIPQDPPMRLKVFAQDFCRALKQVREVAMESGGVVKLCWGDDGLKVTAGAGEQTAEAETFATIQGEGGMMGFNIRFLLEYLKDRQGLVEIGITTPHQSVRFLDGKCNVVMMPVAIKTSMKAKAGEGGNREDGEEGIEEAVKDDEARQPREKEPVTAATSSAKPKKKRNPTKAKK